MIKILAFIGVFAPFVGYVFTVVFSNLPVFTPQLITTSPPTSPQQTPPPHVLQYLFSLLGITICFVSMITLGQYVIGGNNLSIPVYTWATLEGKSIAWSIELNGLSWMMMVLVSGVSFVVSWYSKSYMKKDKRLNWYFAHLNLFTFFMLLIVCCDNWIQLLVGWEGVGLCSYFLINHWYERPKANNAAKLAFVVNRIGDLGLLSAIFLSIKTSQTTTISGILNWLNVATSPAVINIFGYTISLQELLGSLLFLAVMTKSAQIGFHFWLCEAMEGPTPVSALMHGATMVVAGVFLMIKTWPIFFNTIIINQLVITVGLTTLFLCGFVACTQNNIKKILAYSTCSQLGFMVSACGIGCYDGALFHLVTHGCFKSLLFLSAGNIVHCFSSESNIQHMGGALRHTPKTFIFFFVGVLGLIGAPGTSSFVSKEYIFHQFLNYNKILGFIVLASMVLTAIYAVRLLWLVFFGKPRGDEKIIAHLHEAPVSMLTPLIPLLLATLFIGYLFGPGWAQFLNTTGYLFPPPLPSHNFLWEWVSFCIVLLTSLGVVFVFHNNKQKYLIKHMHWFYVLGVKQLFIDRFYSCFVSKPITVFSNVVMVQFFENKLWGKIFSRRFFNLILQIKNRWINLFERGSLVGLQLIPIVLLVSLVIASCILALPLFNKLITLYTVTQ